MIYYIIIPAHNEEAFLRHTLNSIVNQTLLPQKAVIVNDNSTDATEAIIDEYTAAYQFFRKVNSTSSPHTVHLPGSKVIHAFNKGLAVLDDHFDVMVKLDADIVLPPDYFERITAIFKTHPKVGIAGGFAYEKDENNTWVLNHPMNNDHIRGAFKAYTKACFNTIGGLKASIGWDTVDELLAKYHGFETHTDTSLKVKHLRPIGKSYHKKAKLMQGEALYKMRYGLLLTVIASAKMAAKQKSVRAFFNHLNGYFSAKRKKAGFLVNPEEGAFIRRYRYRIIFRKLF